MTLSGSPRPPRKPRPKVSLKMQAIGFLSRREHSRQELRTKLLAAIRKREREDAALAAAAAAHAEDVARALHETPANGIDDAFAPRRSLPRAEGSATPRAPANGIDDAFAPAAAVDEPALEPDAAADAAREPGIVDDQAREPEAQVEPLLDWLEAHGYLSDARFVESRVHARASRQGATRIRHELARHGLVLEPEQAAALRESEFARAKAIWDRKFGEVGADARERARQARFLAARGFASDVVRRIVGGDDEF